MYVAAGCVQVLALDELFVTDVADAMILHRLFGRLWESGLVLVATSNRAPDALYENGLQRQLFLPFIARLKVGSGLCVALLQEEHDRLLLGCAQEESPDPPGRWPGLLNPPGSSGVLCPAVAVPVQESCVIHNMNSPVDYRRLAHHTRGIYFLTPDRTALLHAAFLEAGQVSLAAAAGGGGQAAPSAAAAAAGGVGNPGLRSVQVAMGRQLTVPQALGETHSR